MPVYFTLTGNPFVDADMSSSPAKKALFKFDKKKE